MNLFESVKTNLKEANDQKYVNTDNHYKSFKKDVKYYTGSYDYLFGGVIPFEYNGYPAKVEYFYYERPYAGGGYNLVANVKTPAEVGFGDEVQKAVDGAFEKNSKTRLTNKEVKAKIQEVLNAFINKESINESELKEADSLVWSNTGEFDYYLNLSREDMIQELKDAGWDEEETSDGTLLINADDETIRDYIMPEDPGERDYDDYVNSIEPMIEEQCYDDILVLSGIAANWRGSGEACKVIKVDDLKKYLMPSYDATIKLYRDADNNLYYTEANHDTPMGGTEIYLYSFNNEIDYNDAEVKLQELFDDEDFDMYYFADWAGYKEISELINSGLLKNVKDK